MNQIKMYYAGHEINITQVIGWGVRIKRIDGGLFETVSYLRHHRGKSAYAKELYVAVKNIERQA